MTPDDQGDEVFTLITGDAECVAEMENEIQTFENSVNSSLHCIITGLQPLFQFSLKRNNDRMTECTHVPKRPFYSLNTSGCQSFLILDGLVSQSDVVVVVVVDGDVVVVVAQRACGYLDMKTVVAEDNIEFEDHLT